MLKHEENPETQTQPAAQARVTPEELALALSRIEARKDAGLRNVDGTIFIGEAVQQLGVDTTPEEVLAEVQAIRQEPTRANRRRPPLAGRLVLALGLGGILLGLGLGKNSLSQMRGHQAAKPVTVSTAAPAPNNIPKPISLDPNLLVNTASNKLVMLSEVGDNQPVQCFYDEDNRSFQPYSSDAPGAPESWTLIKHDGQVYVRGWVPHISPQALQKYGVTVGTWESDFNDVDPSLVQLTLPVNGFQVGVGGDRDREFHGVNIHLDKYAHEKWKP